VTLMWFDTLEAVGRTLLHRFDPRSAHYEVRQPRGGA
jgi:hypothetical protein